ncbi:MAG: hypothetical protein FWE95_03075 [Planctomycetaceae bacterium]|nr:hypothetical protein [Planctomycetaceae bacterium]
MISKSVDRLFLTLDYVVLFVGQTLAGTLLTFADVLLAGEVGLDDDTESNQSDETINTNEVMTEQEYIRLLTLYQPVAID